jgi:hypothetical protein
MRYFLPLLAVISLPLLAEPANSAATQPSTISRADLDKLRRDYAATQKALVEAQKEIASLKATIATLEANARLERQRQEEATTVKGSTTELQKAIDAKKVIPGMTEKEIAASLRDAEPETTLEAADYKIVRWWGPRPNIGSSRWVYCDTRIENGNVAVVENINQYRNGFGR